MPTQALGIAKPLQIRVYRQFYHHPAESYGAKYHFPPPFLLGQQRESPTFLNAQMFIFVDT